MNRVDQLRRFVRRRRMVAIATVIACCAAAIAPVRADDDDAVVVARVDGEPITFIQVKRILMGTAGGRQVPADALPLLQARSLEQVIGRRLAIARLKALNYAPTEAELKQAEENFDANLVLGKLSLDEYLKRSRLTPADLDELRYWEICWNRYAQDQLTDEALEKFFQAHRRDFDGTELRVSHILWRIEGQAGRADYETAMARAEQVRGEITAGNLLFADAAAKFSAGPSRERGGDLGFIPRHERMVEEFSTAAFVLKKGEISPPVVTPFGVHLITVTDERPGKAAWTERRDALHKAAQNELYRKLTDELRPTAKVEYTKLVPHLDPATGRVVPAGK